MGALIKVAGEMASNKNNGAHDMSHPDATSFQPAQSYANEVHAARQSGESPQRQNIMAYFAKTRNEIDKMDTQAKDKMRQNIYSYFAGGLNNG